MPFSAIVGHANLVQILRRAVASRRVPQSLLFAGPDGVGKRAVALALGIPGEAVMGLVGAGFVAGTAALGFLLAAEVVAATAASFAPAPVAPRTRSVTSHPGARQPCSASTGGAVAPPAQPWP